MNLDLILFKLFLNKTLFNKYNKVLNLDFYKANDNTLFKLFLALFQYHDQSEEEDVVVDNYVLYLYTLYPLIKAEEKQLIASLLDKAVALEIDQNLALEYLNQHHRQTVATQIAMKALDVSQGRGDYTELLDLFQSAELPVEEVGEDLFVTTDLEELVNNVLTTPGLRWRLMAMNKSLGSLKKGKFGFVFARPETGKTTFLASEVMHMAEQAKEKGLGPVLWLNNEEEGSTVMLRCYQALFGVEQRELYTNLQYYKDEYQKRIGDHFYFFDDANITKKKTEELCEKLQPSLILFDQLDKVHWHESERYDLKMKAIYQWARELAKRYGAVIAVCQAGGTAEGKKYLNMNDVDSSHTAKQGEADFMIGIGKTHTDGEEYLRFLSICKNKNPGDEDSLPELRHGKLPVIIQPEIARYADSVEWR